MNKWIQRAQHFTLWCLLFVTALCQYILGEESLNFYWTNKFGGPNTFLYDAGHSCLPCTIHPRTQVHEELHWCSLSNKRQLQYSATGMLSGEKRNLWMRWFLLSLKTFKITEYVKWHCHLFYEINIFFYLVLIYINLCSIISK